MKIKKISAILLSIYPPGSPLRAGCESYANNNESLVARILIGELKFINPLAFYPDPSGRAEGFFYCFFLSLSLTLYAPLSIKIT
jgi:hypothetical protein